MNGVIADISGMTKPQTIIPIIKRIRQYIKTMEYAGKPVSHVDMLTCLPMTTTKP